jgi:hypothetical protein
MLTISPLLRREGCLTTQPGAPVMVKPFAIIENDFVVLAVTRLFNLRSFAVGLLPMGQIEARGAQDESSAVGGLRYRAGARPQPLREEDRVAHRCAAPSPYASHPCF